MNKLYLCAFGSVINNKELNTEEKIDVINQCLNAGVDINYNNGCILDEAIVKCNEKIIQFLIDNGIIIHIDHIDSAIGFCNNKILELLLDTKPDIDINDHRLLATIFSEEDVDFIKILAKYGLDIEANDNELLCRVCKNSNYIDIARFLLESGAKIPDRLYEKVSLDVNLIKLLVEYGFDCLQYSELLLKRAILNGRLKAIEYFMTLGINFIDFSDDNKDKILKNIFNIKIIELLLKHGLDPNFIINIDGYSYRLLEFYALYLLLDHCKLLLNSNADINLCNNFISRKNFKLEMVKLALTTKIGVGIKKSEKQDIVKLFLEYGLDISENL